MRLLISFLALTAGAAHAQQTPSPAATPATVDYQLNPADVSHIKVGSGYLYFVAGGRHFGFHPEAPFGDKAARISVCFAWLSELRKASKVTLFVQPEDDPQKDSEITDFVFEYDSLKQ